MAELDPLTNLPKDPLQQVSETRERASSVPSGEVRDVSYYLSKNVPSMAPQPVQGAFGRYSDVNVASDRDFNEMRARTQGGFELLGKSVAQAIGSTAGMMIEAAGNIAGVPLEIAEYLTTGERSLRRSPIAQAGKDLSDWVQEIAPIYQTELAQSDSFRRFTDGTFLAANVPTVMSAFAIMVPAMGVSWGAGALAGMARAGQAGQRLAQVVGGSIAGREAEAKMEANEVYEMRREELISEGYSVRDAEARASEEARGVYGASYSNLALDVPSWMIGLRGANLAHRNLKKSIVDLAENTEEPLLQAVRRHLINNPALTTKKAVEKAGFKSWADFVAQAGLEGLEEFNIEIQKERVINNSKILAGEIEGDYRGVLDVYMSGDFTQYLDDPEVWNAAIFGALGGALMGGFQRLLAMKANKAQIADEIKQADSLIKQAQHTQERLKEANDLLMQGDEIGADEVFKLMISDLAIKGIASENIEGAATAGNLDNLREMISGMAELTDSEMSELQLDPAIRENANRALGEIDKIEQIYERNSNKVHGTEIDDIINLYLSEQEYVNDTTRDSISNYNNKLSELYSDPAVENLLGQVTPEQRAYIDSQRELANLRQEKERLEALHTAEAIGKRLQMKISSKARKRSIQDITDRINNLEQEISDSQETLTKAQISEANKIKSELDNNSEITDLERFKLFKEYQLSEGEFTLGELLKRENQLDIAKSIKANDEQIIRQINEFILDEEFGDRSYVRIDDTLYAYEVDSEGNRTIQEVDRELNIVEGSTPEIIEDLGEFGEQAVKADIENIYTPEQYEELTNAIDKDLKDGNYSSAINALNHQIYKSNYSDKVAEIAQSIENSILERVESSTSIPQLYDLANSIADSLSSRSVKNRLREAIKAKIADIRRTNEQQIVAFNEMFADQNREAEQLLDQRDKIESRINELKSIVEERKDEVRQLAEQKNRTQKSILQTHWAVRKRLNDAVESTKDELSELRTLKKKVNAQLKDINKSLDVYQRLKSKLSDTQETPGILVNTELQEMFSEVDAVRAETLIDFNLTDYGLNKLKSLYDEGIKSTEVAIRAVKELRDTIASMHKGSDIAYNAANDALEQMIAEEWFTDENAIFTDRIYERYKNLYNKNLTDSLREYPDLGWSPQQQRDIITTVNSMRITDAQLGNTWDKIINRLEKEVADNDYLEGRIERLQEIRFAIPVYESVLKAMRDAYKQKTRGVEPRRVEKELPKLTGGDLNNPRRRPENVFRRLAGDAGDIDAGMSTDPAQRRYARFVTNNNLNTMASDLQVEIVRPENVGIDLGNLPSKYKKEDVLYAVVQTKDGKYVTEDGSTTDTFDINNSIYTSVPLADYLSHRMSKTYAFDDTGTLVVSEQQLKEMYPRDTVEVAREKYRKYLEDLRNEHQKFLDSIYKRLDAGERVFRNVLGKSNGVPNEITDKSGEPRKLSDYFGRESLETGKIKIDVVTSDKGMEIYGETYNLQAGSVVITDTRNGNVSMGANRGLRKEEIDTVIEALKYMAKNSTISGDKINTTVPLLDSDGNPLVKEIAGKQSNVFFIDVIKSLVYFGAEGSKIRFGESDTPGGTIVIESIRRDGEGLETGIVEESYDIFAEKDGKKVLELNPALEVALRERLSETIHNVESKGSSEPHTKYTFKDGSFSSKQYDSYLSYILDENVVGTWLRDTRDTVEVRDGTEVSEPGITHFNQNIYYDNAVESVVEEAIETTETTPEIDELQRDLEESRRRLEQAGREEGPVDEGPTEQDLEDAIDLDDIQDAGDIDIDDYIDFQRESRLVTLNNSELNKISRSLSKRMDIPMHILSPERSLHLLNWMNETGRIDESFTLETLPKGMYDRGIAYVFSKENVTYDTPFHEISHPIINQIISDNPQLYDNLIQEISGSPAGRTIINRVAEHYPKAIIDGQLTPHAWAEIITTAVGEEAARLHYGRANEGLIGAIKNLWEHIKQFFRNIFGESIHINELSPSTTVGDLATIIALTEQNIVLTPTPVTQFQKPDVSANRLPGKDSKFTKDAVEAFNYFFFRHLLSKNMNNIPLLFSNKGLRGDYYQNILAEVKEHFRNGGLRMNELAATSKNKNQIARAIRLTDNYTYALENWDKLTELHSKYLSRYNIEAVTDDTFSQEDVKDANEAWAVDSLKYSAKHNATSNIRTLIGAMKSNRSPSESEFAVSGLADFGTLFNLLVNSLANTTSLTEMRSIIERSLRGQDGIDFLIDNVLKKMDNIDELTHGDVQMLLEFRKTFAKHYNDYSVIYTGEGGVFDMKDANVNTAKRRLVDKWSKNVDPRRENFKEKGNTVVYDIDSMKKRGLLNTESLRRNDYYLPKENLPSIEREYIRSVNFLKELGIEITTTDLPSDPTEFNRRVDFIYRDVYKGIDTDILSPYSDHRDNVNKFIAEHEVRNSPNVIENSHYRSGETIYNVNLYSYATYTADKINAAPNIDSIGLTLPHLMDTYSQNSLLLNRKSSRDRRNTFLFDGDGNRTANSLNISFIDEFVNENTRKSELFKDLSKRDQTIITINAALNNSFPIFRAGDNSIERHIQMHEFFSSTDVRDGRYMSVYHDYITDELNSIISLMNSDVHYSAVSNKSIEEMLSNYPISNILMDNSVVKDSLITAVRSGDPSIVKEGRVLQNIENTIKRYFANEVQATKQYLIDNNILTKKGNTYENNGLTGLTTDSPGSLNESIVNSILSKATVNRFTANIEQTKIFTGPLIFYSNADNLFKRTSGMVGTKDMLGTAHFENQVINRFYPRVEGTSKRLYKSSDSRGVISEATTDYTNGAKPIIRTQIHRDPNVQSSYLSSLPKDIKKDAYEAMDEADAVGFVSLNTYRDMHVRAGTWDMSMERLYQWEMKGNKRSIDFTNWYTGKVETISSERQLLNEDGSRTTFNMMKPHYFGPLAEQGFIPAMYKTAFLPILPSYDSPAMQALNKRFNDHNIDVLTFPSSNKVGTKSNEDGSIPELYNEEGTPNLENGIIQDTWAEYWGIQLDTGKSVKPTVVKGTQLMKIIFSNIYENGQVINEELGTLAQELTEINSELINKGVNELIEELDLKSEDGRYTVKDVEKLISFLEGEARSRDANNNVLDSLYYLREYWDNSSLGLDIVSNRDKIENILASIADSRVISQRMPGGAKVQTPSTFFERGVRKYVNKEAQLASNELKFYEDGTMEVYLPHYFKELYKELDITTLDKRLLHGVGFRIPTSGLNSIEHIKIVGFLPPSAGETIVLPSEIVAKAGSDFDVDKLNVFLPNYKIVKGQPEYVFYDQDKPLSENSRQQLENRMIEVMEEIISHPDNKSQLLESIGTDLIKAQEKNIIKKLGLDDSRKSMTDAVGNFPYYMEVTKRNNESKQLTGIASLHASDHIHSMRYGYYISEKIGGIHMPHNKTVEGDVSLGGRFTTDGESITSLLNQMVNTAVDGAKEPIFYNLNTNLESAGVIFYLLRSGVSAKNTFEFVNTPIIREYVRLQQIRKSVSNNDLTTKSIKEDVKKRFPKEKAMLDHYLKYEGAAQVLGDYMQATRIDTQAMGKNTSELDLILHAAKKIANGDSPIRNSQKLLTDGGYLENHYKALVEFDKMFEEFFIPKRVEWFRNTYQRFLEFISPKMIPVESKVRLLDKLKSDMITSTVLNNQIYIGGQVQQPIASQLDLIVGDNTVAKRLAEYQNKTDNLYVHALQPVIGKEKYNLYGQSTFIDSVRLYDQRMDSVEVNSMIDAYRELFEENFPLAVDITKLAFMQGGLQLTPMAYTKLIPSEVYIEMLSSAFANQSGSESESTYLRNFIISNYNDNDLVPTQFGKREPSNWIYKKYTPLNLTEAQIEERKRLNQPIYSNVPQIFVDLKADETEMGLFQQLTDKYRGKVIVQPNAIRDNRNNINLLYYGDSMRVRKQGSQPVEIGDNTTTLERAEQIKKLCQ